MASIPPVRGRRRDANPVRQLTVPARSRPRLRSVPGQLFQSFLVTGTADVIAIGKKNLTDDADTKEKAESGKSLWQMGSERREQEAERMKKERQALKKEVASS